MKEHGRREIQDDARYDLEIVKLFKDVAEGWEVLSSLPDGALAQLRVSATGPA
jgi:hypothetical protein